MTTQGNSSNIRTYNRDRRFREKPQITNLTKVFKTFEEGYSELIKMVPEIKAYCGDSILHDVVVGNILDTIRNNIPSTVNTNYPNTLSFSIDSHEVGLRTDAGMAFGWKTFYDRDEGVTLFRFRVTFITIPTHRKLIINNMLENGWETFDTQEHRQSRFWNKMERRPRRSFTPTEDKKEVVEEKSDIKEGVTVTEEVETTVAEPIEEETEEDISSKPINEDIAAQLAGFKVEE